jgi:hypothetical protein
MPTAADRGSTPVLRDTLCNTLEKGDTVRFCACQETTADFYRADEKRPHSYGAC